MKKRILALILALSLLLPSCSGGRKDTAAASMHLRRTEGTVAVSDDRGQDVPPLDNLGLYSGYEVGTQTASYAWIDLDDVKLAKLDQKSVISIDKEGKILNIELKSGNLFFNVTKPLEDDETMNIRTSTLLVGIRGTCGWVVSNGERGAQVFLLEGTVEAEATDTGEIVQVTAGNMAEVTVNENGETAITVQPFIEEDTAPFVLTELENDPALNAAIREASGLDILNPPDPADRLRAEYINIINSHPILDEYAGSVYTANGLMYAPEGLSYAAIFDFDGNGTDELIMVTQSGPRPLTKLEFYGDSQGRAALYGEVDLSEFGDVLGWPPSLFYLSERDGHIYAVVMYGVQAVEGFLVYTIENDELTLIERTGYGGYVGEQYTANWELTDEQNICSPIPDDARMKNALSSCLDTYAQPDDYYYAKLVNTDLYALHGIGSFEKCSWNGTEIERTNLEDNIIYAKLIDMDQDGKEELLLIKDDNGAVPQTATIYSWDASGISKHGNLDVWNVGYDGIYRNKTTGDIYIGSGWYGSDWESRDFVSLTDSVSLHWEGVDPFEVRWIYENGSQEEIQKMEAEVAEADQRWVEFETQLAQFELIEKIDLDSYEWQNSLRYTVDEVRQQLMAR